MSKSRFVAGLRAVEQLLATHPADIRTLYAEYQTPNPRVESLIARARAAGIESKAANRARLQQISGEVRHQGIVAEITRSTALDEAGLRTLVETRLTEHDAGPLLLLILDGLEDPRNLGACLRTADAAGVSAVVLPRHGAAGMGSTVSKVAAGAAENLTFAPVRSIGRVLSWLSEYGVTVIGASDRAKGSLYDADLSGPLALVMGGEHRGLSTAIMDRCDRLVFLPMLGAVSSLNVSVATGICLYEVLRQRGVVQGNPESNLQSDL